MRFTFKKSNGEEIKKSVNSTHVTIGRSSKTDIFLKDDSISRKHCVVEIQEGNFFITELNSANGVYVNSERIPSNVKTKFNSFDVLYLGNVECLVEDYQGSISIKKITEKIMKPIIGLSPKDVSSARKHSSNKKNRVGRPPKKAPGNSSQKNKPSFGKIGLSISGFCILILGLYFQASLNKGTDLIVEKKNPTKRFSSQKQVIREKLPPNEFRIVAEYEQIYSKKNCLEFQKICTQLKLESNLNEGVYKDDREIFVFITASSRKNDPRFKAMSDSVDIEELISLKIILSSDILNDLLLKKIDQIHLVLSNNEGVPRKVFRFHPLIFKPGAAPRFEMIKTLNKVFSIKNSDEFWKLVLPYVPSKDFTI